jgi:hypothetical protein
MALDVTKHAPEVLVLRDRKRLETILVDVAAAGTVVQGPHGVLCQGLVEDLQEGAGIRRFAKQLETRRCAVEREVNIDGRGLTGTAWRQDRLTAPWSLVKKTDASRASLLFCHCVRC